MVGDDGNEICKTMPLLDVTVTEVEVTAVTVPTKSSMMSRAPEAVPVRGKVAVVKTLVAAKFSAKVLLLRVRALFKLKLKEMPRCCVAERVSGNGAVVSWVEPAANTIWQMVLVRQVPFKVAPD